jgi:hypothetical protein
MFLVIFTSLLGHGTVAIGPRLVNTATYYVAAMASFAVISACYTKNSSLAYWSPGCSQNSDIFLSRM